MKRGESQTDLKRWALPALVLVCLVVAFNVHEMADRESRLNLVMAILGTLALVLFLAVRGIVAARRRFERLEIGTDAHLEALRKGAEKRAKQRKI